MKCTEFQVLMLKNINKRFSLLKRSSWPICVSVFRYGENVLGMVSVCSIYVTIKRGHLLIFTLSINSRKARACRRCFEDLQNLDVSVAKASLLPEFSDDDSSNMGSDIASPFDSQADNRSNASFNQTTHTEFSLNSGKWAPCLRQREEESTQILQ